MRACSPNFSLVTYSKLTVLILIFFPTSSKEFITFYKSLKPISLLSALQKKVTAQPLNFYMHFQSSWSTTRSFTPTTSTRSPLSSSLVQQKTAVMMPLIKSFRFKDRQHLHYIIWPLIAIILGNSRKAVARVSFVGNL